LDASIDAAAAARGAQLADPPQLPCGACFGAAARVLDVELPPEAVQLPESILIAVVQGEAGRLCLRAANGRLLPNVLIVHEPVAGERDRRARDVIREVRRAVRRCARALQTPESELKQRLSTVPLHPRMGSLADKAERLPVLAERLTLDVGAEVPIDAVRTVAERCKLDLGTRLVQELPELHGLVGQAWSRAQGDSEEIAWAIRSHLRPGEEGQRPPDDLLGALVGIADRVDTLAVAFAHGLAPTPRQDPLDLRVVAYGLLRTVLAHDLRVDLGQLASLAMEGQSMHSKWLSSEDAVIRMTGFLRHRLKLLLGRSFAIDHVHGVLAGGPLCPASALAELGDAETRSD
jgi:glycyl-tRNA synthetase beta chain